MASGFVSGGTTEQPIERDAEWLQAQLDLEASRRLKEEQSRQQGGKTLYEVLQSNKAAKQEAFEESIRLKNQFRTLDDDEVEFLDSVLESTRAKEEAVKRETVEQLDVFRRQQEEADRALLLQHEDGPDEEKTGKAGSPTTEETQWAVNARKRKRVKEKEGLKGIKLRKYSTTGERPTAIEATSPSILTNTTATKTTSTSEANRISHQLSTPLGLAHGKKDSNSTVTAKMSSKSKTSATPDTVTGSKRPSLSGLGLAGYNSDED